VPRDKGVEVMYGVGTVVVRGIAWGVTRAGTKVRV